jgi:glycosyltransferase involved in cell wall biosynthesis
MILPNGVDVQKFGAAKDKTAIIPAAIAAIAQPVILYVGAVMDWFDWELVAFCARQRPSWQFVLLGPTNFPPDRLRSVPNIYYLGTCQPESVPYYLKRASVCIIPFVMNELTKNVSPLKLYEYLAAGRPVVSVPMPEVVAEETPRCVTVAADADGFVSAIERFLLEGYDDAECSRIANAHSWDGLFARLTQELGNVGLI